VEELVDERGWSACSLQAITRRAGLTTGAVYSTFGSRGGLLAAAMLRRSEAANSLPAGDGDLAAAVAGYAGNYWDATNSAEGMQLLSAQLDLMRLANTDPSVSVAIQSAYAELLETLVADLVSRGYDDANIRPVDAARRLVGVLQGLTLQNFALNAGIERDEFVAAALGAVGL
jgi:AcrR family transcriptional regulator